MRMKNGTDQKQDWAATAWFKPSSAYVQTRAQRLLLQTITQPLLLRERWQSADIEAQPYVRENLILSPARHIDNTN